LHSNLKILVAESTGFPTEARVALSRLGEVTLADLDFAQLWKVIPDFDVIWVRLRHRIDAKVLARTSRLKAIISPTTGLNHIDVDEATRRGIAVLSLRGETDFLKNVHATAEHTIALMLSLIRHIPAATESVRRGQWDRDQFKGRELYGKTVGIIGFGRLGQIVANYLEAFGVRVLATDPRFENGTAIKSVQFIPLYQLLTQADIVSLHVNFIEENRGFFGWDDFRDMKRGAWFVNTSRGELVKEDALLRALELGRLSGAAVDVLDGEQAGDPMASPLIQYAKRHDNLLITPHIGGCTFESLEKTESFLAGKVVAFLSPSSSNKVQTSIAALA
jgi:D-3-phosphoglycerate dehydrogenase